MWITPVFFGSVPGPLKSVIDRFQLFWARRQRGEALEFVRRRPASALIIGAGGDPFGVDGVVIPLTSASNIAEFTLAEPTVLLGIDEPGAILHPDHADERARAHEAVAAFVEAVHSWHDEVAL
jgi:multimeric flavodoxin WrbA